MPQSDAEKSNAILREMYRTSLDSIRVFNPTPKDYVVIWDGYKHIVPASTRDMGFGLGMRILPRYIAQKYVREMKDQLVNEYADLFVRRIINEASPDMKEKYESDPYEKQKLYDRAPKTNDPKQVKKYFEQLWVGIEERYGITDYVDEADGIQDPRSLEEQILDSMNKPVKAVTKNGKEHTPTEVSQEPFVPLHELRKKKIEKEVQE